MCPHRQGATLVRPSDHRHAAISFLCFPLSGSCGKREPSLPCLYGAIVYNVRSHCSLRTHLPWFLCRSPRKKLRPLSPCFRRRARSPDFGHLCSKARCGAFPSGIPLLSNVIHLHGALIMTTLRPKHLKRPPPPLISIRVRNLHENTLFSHAPELRGNIVLGGN